jgi:hypothetical protein
MNNTFELKRFGLVFKKLLFERSLWLLGYFILVVLLTWYVYAVARGDTHIGHIVHQSESFSIGLIVGGILFTNSAFNYFSNQNEGYAYLLLPASFFEKWLSSLLLLSLFVVCFLLFFRTLDTIYMANFRAQMLLKNYNPYDFKRLYDSAKAMPFRGNGIIFTYTFFLIITGITALSTLYFNKAAIPRALLLFFGFTVAFYFFNAKIADVIFGTQTRIHLPQMLSISLNKTHEVVALPPPYFAILSVIFYYFLPAIFWLIALVRMREKEI